MNLRAIWSFIAGDSRFGPTGVLVAILVTVAAIRLIPHDSLAIGALFVGVIAAALVAAVFERVGES